MRRREFITLLGGATVAWPLAARAQQSSVPVIGFMSARSPEDSVSVLQAFHKGLKEEGGFADGESVKVEYRWARGDYGLLPALASEFVERRVNVLGSGRRRCVGACGEGGNIRDPNRFYNKRRSGRSRPGREH
jgi:putative tryptophan/tyrosine transport system substrate-binding protein